MTDEIDDNDFFQQDFTTASEWEIFNARLEEIFHEWKLPFIETGRDLKPDELSLCDWNEQTEMLCFADVELMLTRYTVKLPLDENEMTKDDSKIKGEIPKCQAFEDLMLVNNDYCRVAENSDRDIHPLARWYGLRDFVVLTPKKAISNESQIRILVSSIHVASAESNCEIPIFVQVLEKKQNVFLGVCENLSTRLYFDIIHLYTTPPACKYLTGLLDMFKGKIGVQYVNPVAVSVRFAYSLTKFFNLSFCSKRRHAFDDQDYTDDEEEKINNDVQFNVLPFGVPVDPISEFVLLCLWPQVADNVVIDSQNHSDFDPKLAPIWLLRCRFEPKPLCFLSECISEYLQLCESRKTLSELLGDGYTYTGNLNVEGNPLDLLTESKISQLTSVLPNFPSRSSDTKKLTKNDGPINEDQLMQMLYYMFPDAQPESQHQYTFIESDNFDPMKIKTAPLDSLVHRMSLLFTLCNTYFGGIKAISQVWAEFTQEMRYRVERCIQIPGVACGFPDSRTCLLHQKLQMLNVCMERRSIREGGLPFAMTRKRPSNSGQDDSEDEFYDCTNEDEEEGKVKHAPWNKPEGRLSRLGNMKLVDSDEPLYVPITQEPVPKTEDQLEDDAEVMLKLGPGSELRAQMMSASLLSDMESFKAANPNGKLEDFIRWYSPRDWIENENQSESSTQQKGRLSSRMLIPGNTWQMVWEAAKPVPARRQKRLFDDTKEAEKVMHFLESRNIGQIVQLTLAPLVHSAIFQIKDQVNDSCIIPNFDENYDKLISTCCKLSRESWTMNTTNNRGTSANSLKNWENLLLAVMNMEFMIVKSQSLIKKLFDNPAKMTSEDKEMIASLLNGFDADLKDGATGHIGIRVVELFNELKRYQSEQHMEKEPFNSIQSPLTNPIEKQFTLRLSGKTISKGSGGPQFMRAILGQNEFRLCGAFSQDTTFF